MGPAQRNAWPLPVTGFDQTFLWEPFLSLFLLMLILSLLFSSSSFPSGLHMERGIFFFKEVNI